jgi:hypothetical protein
MAKVQGPLFSFGAAGSIGDSLTFARGRRISVVKSFSVPANPKTVLQEAHRLRIASAVDEFHLMGYTPADLSAFLLGGSIVRRAMAGYHFYMLRAMSLRRRGIVPDLCSGFSVDSNSAGSVFFSIGYYGSGALSFQFGSNPHNLGPLVAMTSPPSGYIWTGELSGLIPGSDVYIRFSNSVSDSSVISGIYRVRVLGAVGPVVIPVSFTEYFYQNMGYAQVYGLWMTALIDLSLVYYRNGEPSPIDFFQVYEEGGIHVNVITIGGPTTLEEIEFTSLTPGYECIPARYTVVPM